jgi:hypothetical protein
MASICSGQTEAPIHQNQMKTPALDRTMPNEKKNTTKTVEAIRHDEATRKNIPTADTSP